MLAQSPIHIDNIATISGDSSLNNGVISSAEEKRRSSLDEDIASSDAHLMKYTAEGMHSESSEEKPTNGIVPQSPDRIVAGGSRQASLSASRSRSSSHTGDKMAYLGEEHQLEDENGIAMSM
jgi:hypothetical protein